MDDDSSLGTSEPLAYSACSGLEFTVPKRDSMSALSQQFPAALMLWWNAERRPPRPVRRIRPSAAAAQA